MSIPRQLQPVPTDELIQKLYIWVDQVPLSRPKRSIARDFSDGVLVAEIVAHFQPGYVELHNYANSSSFTQKMFNWNTLNMKPLKKLGISLNPKDMEDCANCVPGAIEKVLYKVQYQLLRAPRHTSRPKSGRPITNDSHLSPNRENESTRNGPEPFSMDELSKVLHEQDATLTDLRRTVDILTQKNGKLEQLVEIKDKKIDALQIRLKTAESSRKQ